MIRQIDLSDNAQAKAVYELQQLAYSVEATYIGTRDIPPLQETFEAFQTCDEAFIGYEKEGVLVGVLGYCIKDEVIDIHRLFVHPAFFGQQIAQALLQEVERHVHRKVVVMTGSQNQPAVRFYLKQGFELLKVVETSTNLSLSFFQKKPRD